MNPTDKKKPSVVPKTIREIFNFFFFLGRRTGKTRAFFLLGLMPVVLAVIVKINVGPRAGDVIAVFNEILMVFYLQFYIVILSLFYGTSISEEEIEGKTLPYLLTRPLSKPGIIIGKYLAYTWLISLIVTVSLFFSFFIMNSRYLGTPDLYLRFLQYEGILILGILAYTAFFAFLGTLIKRAILFGLVFGFGWENVIQYFPGSTQKFSIVHYLKSLFRFRTSGGGGRLSILLFRLEPTPPEMAVLILILVSVVMLGLACGLFWWKEYLFED